LNFGVLILIRRALALLFVSFAAVTGVAAQTAVPAPAAQNASLGTAPLKLVVLGDSLTAGLGLPQNESFPVKLEQALKAKGETVTVVNAGVSGDTASAGLDRLDWSVGPDTNAVLVELGANDALRGLDPTLTAKALDTILTRLKARGLPVLLAGMEAPRNLGVSYDHAFNAVFMTLSQKYDVIFYPFFLQGVATDPELNQADGMHPNAQGVDVIVRAILPKVEALLARARAKPPA
jgi:acyl-CoA thioesterase-1